MYAYCVGTMMVFGTTCEQICSDGILMRNADREIRGVIYGTAVACGYFGQLVMCLIGGYLFDHVSPKGPFLFVGVLDLTFAIFVIFLGCCGVLKNDIKARRLEADEINARRRKIEEEINRQLEEEADETDHIKFYSINAHGID